MPGPSARAAQRKSVEERPSSTSVRTHTEASSTVRNTRWGHSGARSQKMAVSIPRCMADSATKAKAFKYLRLRSAPEAM